MSVISGYRLIVACLGVLFTDRGFLRTSELHMLPRANIAYSPMQPAAHTVV